MKKCSLIFPAFAILAGVWGAPALAEPLAPSFSKDVVPIFRAHCVACHMTGTEPGKISLVPARAYDAIVNARALEAAMPQVEPKAPERSYLLHKVAGTHVSAGGSGTRMPPAGRPLTAEQIAVIQQWVMVGAPRN